MAASRLCCWAAALVTAAVAGCSAAPPAVFRVYMVTDTGGLHDRSFNAESYAGMQQAASSNPSIKTQVSTAVSAADYAPKIAAAVASRPGLVITVGIAQAKATSDSAAKNPRQDYANVDGPSVPPRVKGIRFASAQGAFLGGYFAAGMTKTGKVATFGGLKIPAVTVFMDGFWEGVRYYNKVHGAHVEVLGWDEAKQAGTIIGTFNSPADGKKAAAGFQAQGADIFFPVAGDTSTGALAQALSSRGRLNAIWVENDGFYSNPAYQSVIMTSVTRDLSSAVSTVVTEAASGQFNAAGYLGTLANGAVALAPFHDFASQVPASLSTELATVTQEIINGSIAITSPSEPGPGQ